MFAMLCFGRQLAYIFVRYLLIHLASMSVSLEEQTAAAMRIPLPPSSPPPPQSPPPHPNYAMLEPWNPSPWGSPPRFPDWVRQAPSPPSPRTPVLPPAPLAPGIVRPSRLDAARRHLDLATHPPSVEELVTAIRQPSERINHRDDTIHTTPDNYDHARSHDHDHDRYVLLDTATSTPTSCHPTDLPCQPCHATRLTATGLARHPIVVLVMCSLIVVLSMSTPLIGLSCDVLVLIVCLMLS